jgi:ADP-heptose:LPS heptosyltransferase
MVCVADDSKNHDSHGVAKGSNTRVVVLFPGALGDLVLAMPALAAVRTRHASAHLTLAVSGGLRALAATSGIADATASLDDADAAGLFGGTRLPAWLGDRPRLYSWIGSRDRAVEERLRSLTEWAELFSVVRDDGDEHAATAYARQVGSHEVAPSFRWPAPASSLRVEELLGTRERPVLAVHAGAGSPTKRWAVEGFAELARRWRDGGGDVVEIVGPADHDLPPIGGRRRVVEWPLCDVAALLAQVDAYAGNDSGISHLAGALGTCGIAVFGATRARRWAPCNDTIAALQAGGPASIGITARALTPARAWEALRQRGCLDKLRSRE